MNNNYHNLITYLYSSGQDAKLRQSLFEFKNYCKSWGSVRQLINANEVKKTLNFMIGNIEFLKKICSSPFTYQDTSVLRDAIIVLSIQDANTQAVDFLLKKNILMDYEKIHYFLSPKENYLIKSDNLIVLIKHYSIDIMEIKSLMVNIIKTEESYNLIMQLYDNSLLNVVQIQEFKRYLKSTTSLKLKSASNTIKEGDIINYLDVLLEKGAIKEKILLPDNSIKIQNINKI